MTQTQIQTTLREIVEDVTGVSGDQIQPHTRFGSDLGIDSLSLVEILVEAEKTLGVRIGDDLLAIVKTFQEAVELLDDVILAAA